MVLKITVFFLLWLFSSFIFPSSFTVSSFSPLSLFFAPPSGTTQSRIFSPLSVEPVIVFAMDLQTYFCCCIVFVFLMGLQCMAGARFGWWIREVGWGLFQGLDSTTDNPPQLKSPSPSKASAHQSFRQLHSPTLFKLWKTMSRSSRSYSSSLQISGRRGDIFQGLDRWNW